MKKLAFLLLLIASGLTACRKSDSGSDAPQIKLIKVTPNTIAMGNTADTVFISFNITDKDANLGNDAGAGVYDIFMVDSRYVGGPDVSEDTIMLSFPAIPPGAQDPSHGLEAVCTLTLNGGYFYMREDRLDADTLHFDIFIKDKTLHTSNTITTEDIFITP